MGIFDGSFILEGIMYRDVTEQVDLSSLTEIKDCDRSFFLLTSRGER